ncbi:MAG: tetratricopeptide repeat protein [Victivallales bacterium]|nr:tetratricopeptide repeat protein [Victivallales bacterium]MBT7163051.1 tetratricopeptide repeat protein [Victivallales bacterium]MBT7299511.1 tetratricopeptide repeat protein [Victivallales bacterium]
MFKRSPLILLAFLLGLGHAMAEPRYLKQPNPARFAALQEKAKRLEAKGNHKKAASTHHRSQVYAPDDRNRAKALLGEANGYYSATVYAYAKDAYLKLLRSYPLYAPQAHILQRLRKLAEMEATGTIGTFRMKDVPEAIRIYETIIQETPTATGTIGDHLRLAELQVASGREEEAVVTYQELIRRHGGHPKVSGARLAYARLLIEQSEAGDGDGRLARQARRQLAAFLKENPQHASRDEAVQAVARIDEQQAQDLYKLAVFYTSPSHRRLPAARRYLHDLIRQYPDTAAADQARALVSELFDDDATGTPVSAEEAEARADLAASPRLADKVVKMLNTVPKPPKAQGTAKQYPPLTGGDDSGKFLLPVGDVNVLDNGE